MASAPRRAVRRQIALLWAGVLLLCLAPAVLAATLDVAMALRHGRAADPGLPRRLALLLGGGAAAAWAIGIVAADRALGPTLDRLHATWEAAEGVELPHEVRSPRLVPTHLTSAFDQLGHRLVEADTRLRAQIEELVARERELRTAREELLRAERLATVGRLAAGVAHEIGNPLGALTGYVEIGRAEPARAPELLSAIGVEAARIDRTVRELMDFARPGKMELEAVPIERALDAAVRLVRAHPRWRSMTLNTELPPGLPPVRASGHHLVQVLVNLFLNAADACDGRGRVRVAALAEPGGVLALTVDDDGPGLPPGSEERIFEPFYTTKERGLGNGLGLAICRQIVESFGGTIRAERGEPGARFRIGLGVAPT